jgi:hypothetical protein
LLEGKNWDEAENRNEIGEDFEQREKFFGHISQEFSSSHAEFDLFSEREKHRGIQGFGVSIPPSTPPPPSDDLDKIIKDVKVNPQN